MVDSENGLEENFIRNRLRWNFLFNVSVENIKKYILNDGLRFFPNLSLLGETYTFSKRVRRCHSI